MKKNCWEFKKCGREMGSSNPDAAPACPAAHEVSLHGVHDGVCGGRACWVIGGTQCDRTTQGTFQHKYKDCGRCDFHAYVKQQEGANLVPTLVLLGRLGGSSLGQADSPSVRSHSLTFQHAPWPDRKGARPRVLIAEDNPAAAHYLSRLLDLWGYDAYATVTSGEEAVKCTEEGRPAVVLLDVELTGTMDGIEAAESIRTSLGIPVIIMTGHSGETVKARAEAIAPSRFFLKPLDFSALRAAIDLAAHSRRE